MKRNIITACYCLIVASLVTCIFSCKKDEQQLEAPRIFKVSGMKVVVSENSAKLTWTAPLFKEGNKYSYTIDFSTDTLFSKTDFSAQTDTTGYTVKEGDLKLRERYFARVKVNATATQPESKYIVGPGSFKIVGTQRFLEEITIARENSVTLFFSAVEEGAKIVITPEAGAAITTSLNSADIAANKITIGGLSNSTKYTAELFTGVKSSGFTSFSTTSAIVYSIKVNPGDNLATIIASAADNAIIGLENGTYELPAVITLAGKTINLRSVNDNPELVKVNFKGFTLLGSGAGLTVAGINFDGTAYTATYFCDLTSASSNTAAAAFKNVKATNSWIHGINTSIIRCDRGSLFTMEDLAFDNCLIYEISGANYYVFHMDKLAYKSLTVTNSTFYNISPGLVSCRTVMPGTPATITISNSTINNIGFNSNYLLMNAAANPVNFVFKNSILANGPRSGAVLGIINSTAAAASIAFTNNNTFNLKTAIGGTALPLPGASTQGQTVDPGWNAGTVKFILPEGSILRTSSSTGRAVGDPRWTF